MATTCNYTTITIPPNGEVIIPPGAELVASTNSQALTAVDDCVDLTKLESFNCYVAKVVGFDNSNGIGEWFETDGHQCLFGYILNGQYVELGCNQATSGWYNGNNQNGFFRQMVARIPEIVACNAYFTTDGSSSNLFWSYQIKTIPSIADNLEMLVSASAESFLSGLGVTYRIKFALRNNSDPGNPPSLC